MASKKTSNDLTATLARLDALLAAVNPDARKSLNAGASAARVAKLSKAVFHGKPVPREVAALFAWHDGQSKPKAIHPDDNRTLLSIDAAIDAWKFLSDPKEDVLQPWSKTWLPIFENGAGDYVCVETAGKKAGSLVAYWHADADRKTVFPSIAAWASDVARALEQAAKKAKSAPKKVAVTIDAANAKWSKLAKPPAKGQVAKKAIGTVLWFRKTFAMSLNHPLFCFYVKIENGTEKPWRYITAARSLEAAIDKIKEYLASKKPPADYEWKTDDFSVAWACKEDAFDKEDPSPVGLLEGQVRVAGK
jgi:cell wall assembly regulator SMI1